MLCFVVVACGVGFIVLRWSECAYPRRVGIFADLGTVGTCLVVTGFVVGFPADARVPLCDALVAAA